MPEPDYAAVEILCDPARLEELEAIDNLVVRVNPLYTDDPAQIRIYALADAAAQAAAAALGCIVTVRISAADFKVRIDTTYGDVDEPMPPDDLA